MSWIGHVRSANLANSKWFWLVESVVECQWTAMNSWASQLERIYIYEQKKNHWLFELFTQLFIHYVTRKITNAPVLICTSQWKLKLIDKCACSQPITVPYPHCILITSSQKIKLWEESATDEAIGMQRGYEQMEVWKAATRGGGRVAKDNCFCGVQDENTTL